MKCPHCEEEIKRFEKVCPICGEMVAPVHSYIDIVVEFFKMPVVKKALLCSVLASALVIALLQVGAKIQQEINKGRLTETGYNSIQTPYQAQTTPLAVMEKLSQMEADLDTFWEKSKKAEDKEKLFGIFMQDVFLIRGNYYNAIEKTAINGDKSPISNGLETEKTITDATVGLVKIISPYVESLKFHWLGGYGLDIDNVYLKNKYGKDLSEAWNTYFDYSKQYDDFIESQRDVEYTEVGSEIIYGNACKGFIDKWEKFLADNPNFPLNSEIEKEVQEMKESLEMMF